MSEKISRSELIGLFIGINKCKFATIKYRTSARLRKTGCPFGEVDKIVTANIMIGADYKRAVEKAMASRGLNPEAEIHSTWGKHICKSLVENTKDNNTKTYLESIFRNVIECKYVEVNSQRELTRQQIENWLPNKSDEMVKYRRTDLSNIISVKIDSSEYIIG